MSRIQVAANTERVKDGMLVILYLCTKQNHSTAE